MLTLKNIEKEELNEFVKTHKTKSHFLQSATWGDFCKKEKKVTPYFLGLVDENDKIQATAMLLQKKLPLNFSYLYCPRGYVLDYNKKEVLKKLTEEMKRWAKKKKALYVKIDPDIKLQNLDLEGNKVDDFSNYELVEYLENLGYKHLGFNKAFEHNQPRYTFRLNLEGKTIEEIKNNFHNTTKKIINKGNPFELEIEKDNIETIDDFYETMKDTARRENISLYSKEYFENFYKILNKQNMSNLYTIYLNVEKTKQILEDKIKELTEKQEKLNSPNKKKEFENQIQKQEKLLEEVKEMKEEKYPLSSIITTKFGDKVWTIHGGNSSKLRELNSNYLIYYKIIEDAVKEGYKTIDFFGTSYNPKETDPEYGIYLFKKRLGGEYTEFIGEFDLITNKPMYFIFNKLIPIYRNLVKRKNRKEIQNETSKH